MFFFIGSTTFSYGRKGNFNNNKIAPCERCIPCYAHELPEIYGLPAIFKNTRATVQDEERLTFNCGPFKRNTPTQIDPDKTAIPNGTAVVPEDAYISRSSVTPLHFLHCLLSNNNRPDKTTI